MAHRSLAALNKVARFEKTYVPTKAVVPDYDTLNSASPLTKPPGGWRNPTITDLAIIATIEVKPGLTPIEYAELALTYPNAVHDCILMTRQGRLLAENGNVALPKQGRRPRWVEYVRNPENLATRLRDYQGPKLRLTGNIPSDIRSNSRDLDASIRAFACVRSPRKRAAIKREINDNVHVQALAAKGAREQIETLKLDLEKVNANLSHMASTNNSVANQQLLMIATAMKNAMNTIASALPADELKAISA